RHGPAAGASRPAVAAAPRTGPTGGSTTAPATSDGRASPRPAPPSPARRTPTPRPRSRRRADPAGPTGAVHKRTSSLGAAAAALPTVAAEPELATAFRRGIGRRRGSEEIARRLARPRRERGRRGRLEADLAHARGDRRR